jgi:hypothetical protein
VAGSAVSRNGRLQRGSPPLSPCRYRPSCDEKCDSHAVDEADRYLRERRCGSFSRSVILPDGVDAGTVTAVYENGGLTVRIPVPDMSPAENDAHEIQIEIAV